MAISKLRSWQSSTRRTLLWFRAAAAAGLLGSLVPGCSLPAFTHKQPTQTVTQTSAQSPEQAQQRLAANYGKLPLSFEANQGQVDGQVKFLARGRGYTLFLTADEAVLALQQGKSKAHTHAEAKMGFRPHDDAGATPRDQAEQAVVRIKLLDANPDPAAAGLEELPGKVNYFIGNDPAKWRTNVPTYAKVQYAGVYPGVDLVYYGNQGQLEYDLVVGPGADPGQIQLAFEGTDDIERDTEGNLILKTNGGALHLKKPLVYQDVNGAKQPIAAEYVVHPQDRIAAIAVEVKVAAYDVSKPLIIDPVLVYSTYLGGGAEDGTVIPGEPASAMNLNIAVDGSGNAYLTMTTDSADFPITGGAVYEGAGDAVVARLNAAGSSLLCAAYFGGSGYDEGHGIALDSIGNAYVTGRTQSDDFPVSAGAFDTTFVPAFPGDSKAHLSKFDTSCAPVYITYLGGTVYEWGHGIAVDGVGNAYVTGGTVSPDFPTTAGAFDTTCGTDGACNPTLIGTETWTFADAFVVKIRPDPSGPTPDPSDLLYSTYLGGSYNDHGNGVAVDGTGRIHVVGYTVSTNFPTLGAYDSDCGTDGACNDGVGDGFMAKVEPTGSGSSDLLYSTYLGGSGEDPLVDVVVDTSSHAYIAGRVTSNDFPTTAGAYDTTFNGVQDEVLVKLNPSASGAASLVYSTYLGGSGDDDGHNIAVDAAGNIYTNGGTTSTDFPTTGDALSSTLSGSTDAYVVKLRPAGLGAADLKYSTYLGGSGVDRGHGVDVDAAGNVYTAGQTSSPFPVTPGAYDTSYNGGTADVVVGKICPDPPATPNAFIATGSLSLPRSESSPIVTVLSDGRVLVEGGQMPAATPSADLYDPALGTWGSTGSMNAVRAAHTATALPNGKVLVAGGDNGGARLDSAELYDPATGTWSLTGSMSTTRAKHTAVLLPNGKVLAMGGVPNPGGTDNALTSAELYDPVTGTWSPTGPMNEARFHFSAVLLANGKVLVAGGCRPNDCLNPYSSAEIYDPATGNWNSTGSMGTARQGQGIAVRLPNGQVLIAGGGGCCSAGSTAGSSEVYDPASGVWSVPGAMVTPRQGHKLTLLSTGVVLATGGADALGWLASAELYDPATGLWTATGSLATARSGHQAMVLTNGNVLVAGGGNSTGVLSSAELYTPALCGTAITPLITGVNPSLVTYGVTPSGSITINGLNFVLGATITVGGLSGTTAAGATASAATPFVWVDSTLVEFYWPNMSLAPGTYDVQVTNPPSAGGLSDTLALSFTVLPATPVISGVSPASVTYGVTPSSSITINGSGFVLGAVIDVGFLSGSAVAGATATPAIPFVWVDSTHLEFYWHNTTLPPGPYDVVVTNPIAVGGLGDTAPGGFVVLAAAANSPPTITTGNQTVNEGALLQFTISVTDPDAGDTVTVVIGALPTGASFNPATQQVTWTPAPNQGTCPSPYTGCAGTYPIEITASDGTRTTSKTIVITVNDSIVDSDLDGYPDTVYPSYPADNCPHVYNPNQADFDGDGKGDICDTPDKGGDSPVGSVFVGKVTTDTATLSSVPANGTSFVRGEPVFITAKTTFRRVDYRKANGDPGPDGTPDVYYAVRPDPFNIFLQVFECGTGQAPPCTESNGTPVHANRIMEAPILHIPNDLLAIPGGNDPCPAGTKQLVDGACEVATTLNVTESRTAFNPGVTVTITPTYFNFLQDPELGAPTDPDTGPCITVEQGCYSPIWMGLAQGPSVTIQAATGTTVPPSLEPPSFTVSVNPAIWDPRWATIPSTGFVDAYVGDLPAGYTVNQIMAGKLLLNGSVPPTSFEILSSYSGFSGSVLHLRYPQAQAIASLQALLARLVVPGEQVNVLLTGQLTSSGAPGALVAQLRATPQVSIALTAPTWMFESLIATVEGFNLKQGIENSLDAKIQNALAAFNKAKEGDFTTSCNMLNAFISEVQAQSGKAITVAQADQLIAMANQVKAVLGCG